MKSTKNFAADDKRASNLKERIMKVLEFLRVNNFEIMFIYKYKKHDINYCEPELMLSDLWEIYEFDAEWLIINQKRKELNISY